MRKPALLVLAASSILAFLTFGAEAPDGLAENLSAEPAGVFASLPEEARGPVHRAISELKAHFASPSGTGPSLMELPKALADLPPEQQELVWRYLGAWARAQWDLERSPAPRRFNACLAGGGDPLCDFGAAVSRMKPCLAAGECPAVEAWRQAMGRMGVMPAPRTMIRAVEKDR